MSPAVLEVAIEAVSRTDQDKLVDVLKELSVRETPFGFSMDDETGQIVIKGESERQLEFVIDRLQRRFGIAVNVGAPQVAYRETLGRRSEIDYTHKKLSGGSGQFARIMLVFEPGAPGSGYSFENKVVGGSIPREFILGVEKGLAASRETGVLEGFPVIDFKATLVDGNYHDVDSSMLAFEIAARAAFREGLAKAQCKLLEPIMMVEVVTPLECGTDCIDDFVQRRGRILGVAANGDLQIANVLVPLANLLGYATTLRMMSHGRAVYRIAFDHCAAIPCQDPHPPPSASMALRA